MKDEYFTLISSDIGKAIIRYDDDSIAVITPHVTGAYLDAEVLIINMAQKDVSLYYPLVCKRFSGKFHHVIYTKTKQNFSNKNYYTV